MASSPAPRRGRASVTFGLLRLKSCPQGQLNYLSYPHSGSATNNGLLPPRARFMAVVAAGWV